MRFLCRTRRNRDIGQMRRVFANGPGDRGSIPGRVIPKTQKIVPDTALLNTQHYKVRIKGKVEQSMERSSLLPLNLGVVAIEKGAFGLPFIKVANFTLFRRGHAFYYIYLTHSLNPPYCRGLKYADCILCREVKHPITPKIGCPKYETKVKLIARLHFWRPEGCGKPFHCH